MELRHLDALLAITDAGSFSAAADVLHTVQSNVSEQIRQLERELGVPVLLRGRRGAIPTEFGQVVLTRARRVRGELEALKVDLSLLQGLEAGHSSFGVVGTASRWIVPELVADLQLRAPGVRLRITEGASERLAADVLRAELAMAVITEPVVDARLRIEHLLDEELVGLVPSGTRVGSSPVSLEVLAGMLMILPPVGNPFRDEIERVANAAGLSLNVSIEVEGIRLIADLVAAGRGVSVLPQSAVPPRLDGLRQIVMDDLPPRRLTLVSAQGSYLSLADGAIREAVLRIVATRQG